MCSIRSRPWAPFFISIKIEQSGSIIHLINQHIIASTNEAIFNSPHDIALNEPLRVSSVLP